MRMRGGVQPDVYRITTAGPAFPGLTVCSENTVRVELDDEEFKPGPPSLRLRLVESALKANGPKLLVNIFLASQENLEMTSLNTITVVPFAPPSGDSSDGDSTECDQGDGDDAAVISDGAASPLFCFESSVRLDLAMSLPRWVPIPVSILERRGSSAFQKMLDKDVTRLLEAFREEYSAWSGGSGFTGSPNQA